MWVWIIAQYSVDLCHMRLFKHAVRSSIDDLTRLLVVSLLAFSWGERERERKRERARTRRRRRKRKEEKKRMRNCGRYAFSSVSSSSSCSSSSSSASSFSSFSSSFLIFFCPPYPQCAQVDVKTAVAGIADSHLRMQSTQDLVRLSEYCLAQLPKKDGGDIGDETAIAAALLLGLIACVKIDVLSEAARATVTSSLINIMRAPNNG